VFRVLRPRDLVVLDVSAYGLDLVTDGDGPALVADGDGGRLEVRLPFQHLGERAYYAMDKAKVPATTLPPGAKPPGKGKPPVEVPVNEGDEPLDGPPIDALAANGSRLVFAVAAGARIAFSSEGVLAAMSRLPLLVVPLATPRPRRCGGRSALPTSSW
jgi:hypothetical protein